MTAPHCPTCQDDVSVPYDYGCWRCQACGAVFAVYDADDLAAGLCPHDIVTPCDTDTWRCEDCGAEFPAHPDEDAAEKYQRDLEERATS